MEQYKIDSSINTNKVFIVKRSELEDKLEVSYHHPNISELENRVRSKSSKKLKDFIQKVSSGATPSVSEEDKYYSDSTNGIPFLRVQNLQSNGKLNLSDVKYINKETHETYLKRSQVDEGDLLVKITGVGRMAIASVAPENFIGNTNQHMVVIKTENKETSKYLSNYLNLDFVEKLATRRATGGTRPALDYAALKSIPIIEGIDFNLLRDAEKLKQTKEAEAKQLLASIDTYLLNELGITLPQKDNSLESRIFTTKFSELSGGRFDPKLYDRITTDLKQAIKNIDTTKFVTKRLKDILIESVAGDWGIEDEGIDIEGYTKCLVIRATEFNNDYNLTLDNSRVKYRLIKEEKLSKLNIKEGDLLIEKSGGSPDQPVGRIALITNDYLDKGALAFSNFIHKITVDEKSVNSNYLFSFLKTVHNIKLTEAMQSQTNGIRNLIMSTYLNQNIVLPIDSNGNIDLNKQIEIADYIAEIRSKAKKLQEEANSILEKSKQEVEQIILG